MSANLIKHLLACSIASAIATPQLLADDHCCHAQQTPLPILLTTTPPCCGNPPQLHSPVPFYNPLPPPPAAVLPGGAVVDPFGFPIHGIHARFPYYNYRAPWAPPGPPQFYRTITW